jgi:hypothetical protein
MEDYACSRFWPSIPFSAKEGLKQFCFWRQNSNITLGNNNNQLTLCFALCPTIITSVPSSVIKQQGHIPTDVLRADLKVAKYCQKTPL